MIILFDYNVRFKEGDLFVKGINLIVFIVIKMVYDNLLFVFEVIKKYVEENYCYVMGKVIGVGVMVVIFGGLI